MGRCHHLREGVTTAGPPKDTRGQLAESKHFVLPWHRSSGWALCPSRDGKNAGPWWGGASPPGGPVQSPPSRASGNRDVFMQPPPASSLHSRRQIKQCNLDFRVTTNNLVAKYRILCCESEIQISQRWSLPVFVDNVGEGLSSEDPSSSLEAMGRACGWAAGGCLWPRL